MKNAPRGDISARLARAWGTSAGRVMRIKLYETRFLYPCGPAISREMHQEMVRHFDSIMKAEDWVFGRTRKASLTKETIRRLAVNRLIRRML